MSDCPHTNNQFGRCDQGKACQCAADEERERVRVALGKLREEYEEMVADD